jgi:hypothetical protein
MRDAVNRRRTKYHKKRATDVSNKRESILNLTDIKPEPQQHKSIESAVSRSNQPMFMTIPESKGGSNYEVDEYENYSQMWDGNADEQLINSGATIMRSEITLTDSSGNNRVLVRRNSDTQYY